MRIYQPIAHENFKKNSHYRLLFQDFFIIFGAIHRRNGLDLVQDSTAGYLKRKPVACVFADREQTTNNYYEAILNLCPCGTPSHGVL